MDYVKRYCCSGQNYANYLVSCVGLKISAFIIAMECPCQVLSSFLEFEVLRYIHSSMLLSNLQIVGRDMEKGKAECEYCVTQTLIEHTSISSAQPYGFCQYRMLNCYVKMV